MLFSLNALLAGNDFVKSEIRQAELKLYFASEIERVTYFTLPDKEEGYTKYVFDIHGATLPSFKGISHHTFRTIKSFRIAQNSEEKVRVVILSKEKGLDKHHNFEGNVLAIPLVSGQQSTLTKERNVSKEKKTSTKKSAPKEKKKSKEKKSVKEKKSLKEREKKESTPQRELSKSIYTDHPHRYIVVIDAGHGGKDNGASSDEKKEKDVVFSVAKKLQKKLKARGYTVYMTRTTDSFVKLPKRTEFANEKKADIFVSIHANAAPQKSLANEFKGIEVYYLSPAKTQRAKEAAEKENAVLFEGKDYYTKNAYLSLLSREKIVESHKLAIDVDRKLVSTVREHYGAIENGGVKGANFWVLVGAQMPAILVETGYITNSKEGENLMNNYYRSLLAEGIAKGIERYLKNK